MGSNKDENSTVETHLDNSAQSEPLPDQGRRRFSRTALAGGVVLASLGNRSAWGQTVGCMSVTTIASFNPATGMFVSAPGGRPDHDVVLAGEIHHIGGSTNPYLGSGLGRDGITTYTTCQDTINVDNVCLEVGPECPLP